MRFLTALLLIQTGFSILNDGTVVTVTPNGPVPVTAMPAVGQPPEIVPPPDAIPPPPQPVVTQLGYNLPQGGDPNAAVQVTVAPPVTVAAPGQFPQPLVAVPPVAVGPPPMGPVAVTQTIAFLPPRQQRCANVPRIGHPINIVKLFLQGLGKDLSPSSPTTVKMIYQRCQNDLLIFIYELRTPTSLDFFSVVYSNGSVKDFYMTLYFESMLSHHRLTPADIHGMKISCPGIKEQFGFQVNPFVQPPRPVLVGSAAP